MACTSFEQKLLNLNVDVSELNQQQVRLIKSINSLLTHIMSTDDEDEYFESSSELMRIVAMAVKKSNFSTEFQKKASIPYGQQALEYCVDILSDQVYGDDVVKYDN